MSILISHSPFFLKALSEPFTSKATPSIPKSLTSSIKFPCFTSKPSPISESKTLIPLSSSSFTLEFDDDDENLSLGSPWEGAVVYKRDASESHLEYCTTLERLGLGKLSTGVSKSRASAMGIRLPRKRGKEAESGGDGTPVLVSVDVTRRKRRLKLDGIVRTVITLGCNRHFVPNLTIGAPVIESLQKHSKAYLDCHLMDTNPMDYVEPLAKAGASGFTFHVEVSKGNWQELIHRIKTLGMQAGVALKPGTPIEEVYPLVESSDCVQMVLVMTVEPGFGGQKFMPEMMDKVRTLRKRYPLLDIEVDGGVGPSTVDMAAAAGANCIVAGSSVFGAKEPAEAIALLRKSVEAAQQNS